MIQNTKRCIIHKWANYAAQMHRAGLNKFLHSENNSELLVDCVSSGERLISSRYRLSGFYLTYEELWTRYGGFMCEIEGKNVISFLQIMFTSPLPPWLSAYGCCSKIHKDTMYQFTGNCNIQSLNLALCDAFYSVNVSVHKRGIIRLCLHNGAFMFQNNDRIKLLSALKIVRSIHGW